MIPNEGRLVEILRANEEFVHILQAVTDVDPPQWAVGAGVVRDIVWDHLHGYVVATPHRDVDMAFFDPTDLSPDYDRRVTDDLVRRLPAVPWEAKNHAAVHTWWDDARFGSALDPLTSIEEAVGMWPETATCVAVRSVAKGDLEVIAPFGLSDLFGMVLRRNRRVPVEVFRQRLTDKRIVERWPRVRVVEE